LKVKKNKKIEELRKEKLNNCKKVLKGGQINIRSFESNRTELIQYIHSERIDFVLLSETLIQEVIDLKQYILYNKPRKDSLNNWGGVGIIINKRYNVEVINNINI
jgi:hypothetical protein